MSSDITRREFFRRLGRYACLGVLGGMVFELGLRPAGRGHTDRSGATACAQCRAVPYCSLPEAVRARRERAEKTGALAARDDGLRTEKACPYRSG